jgi:hypothetical protein
MINNYGRALEQKGRKERCKMKWLNGYRMSVLNGAVMVIVLSVVNAWGTGFMDDFNRPDGEVGNGWMIWKDGTIESKIVDNEVLIAGQQGHNWWRSGISRFVEDETRFSFDFKADDSFNVHIQLYDAENPKDMIDFYAWPGGPFSYGYNYYDESNNYIGDTGWITIPGSEMIAGQYNNLVVEQNGTEFMLTLNGRVVGTATKNNILRIGEVFIASDAAAGTIGSLHIDNVVIVRPIVDFNGDGIVDAADMCIMIDHWGTDNSMCDIGPMPWGDGIVDVEDLIVLAGHLFTDYRAIAQWKLDELEGDIAFDSVGVYDARLYGEPLWQPTGAGTVGALQFDGTDDYASTNFIINPGSVEFSVIAWTKGSSPGQVIISQKSGFGNVGATWLGMDASDGKLITGLTSPAGDPLESETVITDGQWHHIGFVWDGSYRTLYVDGIEAAKDTVGLTELTSSTGGMYIGVGKDRASTSFFSGLIDDIRIYKKALSSEEIAVLAQ